MSLRSRLEETAPHLIQAGGELFQAGNKLMPLLPLPRRVTKISDQFDALTVMRTLAGYQTAAALVAATKLNLFEFLTQPRTPKAAGEHMNMTPEAAQVLMDAVALTGLVRVQNRNGKKHYVNTTMGNKIFMAERWSPTDRWATVRGMIDLMVGTWSSWADLSETMQKDKDDGHPQMKVYNRDNPMIANYIEITTTMLAQPVAELIDTIDISNVRHIVCGVVGISAAAAVMQKNPQADLTVSCLQQLIDHLPQALEAFNCKEPREIIVNTGDATKDRWGEVEQYDMVFLFRKFAYCGPEHGIDYLKKSLKVISPGGWVILWEPFLENFRLAPWMGTTSALLDSLLGESHPLWRIDEVADFARQAGYDVHTYHCKNGISSFVVARAPM